MDSGVNPVRNIAIGQLRGFFAWLALTPAIFCWGLLLLITFVITWQGFRQQTDVLLEAAMSVYAKLNEIFPLVKSLTPDLSALVNDSGVIEINNHNLVDVIFKLYGWVALPVVVFGLLRDIIKGPGSPRPLGRKIKNMGYATLAIIFLLFLNVLIGSGEWTGNKLVWSLMFTIGPGVVFMISSISLYLHHVISVIRFEANDLPDQ